MIKILLVDDHSIFRSGVRELIELKSDFKVTGEAGTLEEALILVGKNKFHIAVLDISLPDSNGLDSIQRMKSVDPEIKILMLSTYDESIYGVRAFKKGATGYLTKDCSIELMVSAIHKIISGGVYISPNIAESIAQSYMPKEKKTHKDLSDREFEVLKRIVRGTPIAITAAELKISTNTVKTYRARILVKLGYTTTPQLVGYAIENNLLTLKV